MSLLVAFVLSLMLVSENTAHLSTQLLYICQPFGWASALYVKGISSAWWALLPMLALLASVPKSLTVLRRLNADGCFRQARSKIAIRLYKDKRPAANTLVDWSRLSFIEGLLSRFLTSREQAVAQTLLAIEPRWNKATVGLVTYALLFLIATGLIYFGSLQDVVVAIRRFDVRAGAAFIGCIATPIFFALIVRHGVALFLWYLWPEAHVVNFRLLPISQWEAVRVVAKVNTFLALLLLPPAILISLSPIFKFFEFSRAGVGFMLKCLVGLWALTVFAPSMRLSPGFHSVRYWRSLALVTFVAVAICGSALGLVMSPTLTIDLVLIGTLLIVTPGWITYAGVRYCRGR